MANSTTEQRAIADFNKGRISAKRAAKLIKKAAARKGKQSRRAWK